MDEAETQPLISSQSMVTAEDATGTFFAPNITFNDEPPPYTPTATGAYSRTDVTIAPVTVNCRVCHATLNIDNKLHLHVIKCSTCGEATPIRPAPAMKKYVRCPCNCLLLCKVTSHRVVCPRLNCKRVISLVPVNVTLDATSTSRNQIDEQHGMMLRVVCAYCNCPFMWKPASRYVCLKCPNCTRHSFEAPSSKSRAISRAVGITLLFVAFSILLSYFTFTIDHDSLLSTILIVLLSICYCLTISACCVSIYYSCLRVSEREVASQANMRYT